MLITYTNYPAGWPLKIKLTSNSFLLIYKSQPSYHDNLFNIIDIRVKPNPKLCYVMRE